MKAVNIQGTNLRADNWVGQYLHRVNVESGHILIGCFGNFYLRMPQRCPPVGSQEVGVVVLEEQKRTNETRTTAEAEAGRGEILAYSHLLI